MTNEELISKIKAELERLYNDKSYSEDRWDMGYDCACEDIMSFLSTLESENPMQEGLEEELKDYLRHYYNCDYPKQIKDKTCSVMMIHLVECARHFAQWGAERQKSQDDRLVDIIYQQGIEKGKDEMRETLKRKKKK